MVQEIEQLRQQICQAAKQAYQEGLFAGTSGNLSLYNEREEYFLITPSSLPYEQMSAEDIVVLHLDGTVLQGKREPSSEWRMHAAVYRELPRCRALVHTHSPYATAYAAAGQPIPAALIEMAAFLGGEVPLAKFAMPGSWELGQAAAAALRERNACLLANHGVLAAGESLERAHLYAVYTEDAAKICALAKLVGGAQVLDMSVIGKIKAL